MGLMVARVGHAMSGTAVRGGLAFAGAAAASTGLVLAGQYAYGDSFSTPQDRPTSWNHAIGGGGAGLGGIGMLGAWLAAEEMTPGIALWAAVGAGAATGAYLVAPVLRRLASE